MLIFLMITLGVVTFLMGFAILLQEPKTGGLSGAFGMGGDQMLGASSASGISRFTTMLAVVFFGLSIAVGVMSTKSSNTSAIRGAEGDQSVSGPAIEAINPGGGLRDVPLPPGTGDGAGGPVGGTPGETDEGAAAGDSQEGGANEATATDEGTGDAGGADDGAAEESGGTSEEEATEAEAGGGEAVDGENSEN